jgi:hypothetical protein
MAYDCHRHAKKSFISPTQIQISSLFKVLIHKAVSVWCEGGIGPMECMFIKLSEIDNFMLAEFILGKTRAKKGAFPSFITYGMVHKNTRVPYIQVSPGLPHVQAQCRDVRHQRIRGTPALPYHVMGGGWGIP